MTRIPTLRIRLAMACLTLLQAGCSTPQSTVAHEHYDPAYLNAEAVDALATGDRGTALILLERAALLAPADALVTENLAALKAGGVLRKKAATTARASDTLPPAPEAALWPMQ